MTFIDLLRQARSSTAATFHEFLTQYDPNRPRAYAFVEGQDDAVFYRKFLQEKVPTECRILFYRCDGKERVYQCFEAITSRIPNARGVVFFVDKDLDDILGTPWPTDPRIFVTETYSIENYLVDARVLEAFCLRTLRTSGVTFDVGVALRRFDEQLSRFQRQALPLMALILSMRRRGVKPNLSNVDPRHLFEMKRDCSVSVRCGKRLQYLAGAANAPALDVFRRVIQVSREVRNIPAKRIVRGKFEVWFLIEFWKKLIAQLQELARESGGSIRATIALERSNCVGNLVGDLRIPRSLDLFLGLHFPSGREELLPARRGKRTLQETLRSAMTFFRRG